MSDAVTMTNRPVCDLCARGGAQVPAWYDAKTVMGPWAYVCADHFDSHTNGALGTGWGQRLLTGPADPDDREGFSDPEWETCSWCTALVPDASLADGPDGARLCVTCWGAPPR